MDDFERFAKALALTESNDNPRAWGDEGLACGRWQIHPAWFHDWYDGKVMVDDSWDTVFRRCLVSFWKHHSTLGRAVLDVAMRFHLGEAAVNRGAWDVDYGDRFARAYGPTEAA
jgi:hypothetical protein